MEIQKIKLPNSSSCMYAYLREDDRKEKKHKSVLIFPGGGYTHCSKREGKPIAVAYAKKGYQAFVLEYRTENPFNFEHTWYDANTALSYLYNHANELHLDKKMISLIGFSAGGHLAALLAVNGKVRPSATILCYPMIIDSLAKLVSPQLYGVDNLVDKNTPPVFIFSTFEDHVVPVRNTICFIEKLNEQNIPFECHIYEWGHHGLALCNELTMDGNPKNIDERASGWFELSLSWLDKLFSTNFAHPKKIKKNTVGYILENSDNYKDFLNAYPILKNKEVIEAISHLTPEKLQELLGILKAK